MRGSHFDKPSVTPRYRLTAMGSDPFAATREALYETIFGDVRYTPETESTNADALRLLEEPEKHGGVTIVADFQYHGRGRRGREWIAAPGSALLFTTILPVTLNAAGLWAIPFWCALAIKEALALHDIETTLQWPNDILLQERKLAGTLCVSRGVGTRAWAACGVGINVNNTQDSFYEGIEPQPAFLSDVSSIQRAGLLTTILRVFAATFGDLEDPDQIARRWETAAELHGTAYRLLIDGEMEPIVGTAERLGSLGALVVRHNGQEREISFADARVLR